jgi:hypothetical protein
MNGRYTLDTEGKYRDDNEHTVYPLQFQGSTIHAGDKLRMSRPALTIGATREDAQPWFQKEIEEAEIIKFPEPVKNVVELPNVQSYPDFLTGVKDLHNRRDRGEISQDSHDRLYTDLIHRFMKKESFENPWFLRESGSRPFLTGYELLKYKDKPKDRIPTFINDIASGAPFIGSNGEQVIINKNEVEKFKNWAATNDEKTPELLTLQSDKGIVKITKTQSPLAKTPKYGGTKTPSISGKERGKESYKVKPSDVGIVDKEIPAGQLGQTIIKALTPIATSDPVAKEALELAQRILKGDSRINMKYLSQHNQSVEALRDYAGEYLGVLMVVQGLAKFENSEPFYKHLDVAGFNELNIFFPSKSNNPLADSVGTVAGFKNPKTGFKIMISSKGGASGKGAATAMGGFKIPDEFKKNTQYKEEIEFMQANEQATQYTFPFALMDVIFKHAPDSISDKKLLTFLPFGVVPVENAKEDKKMISLFKHVEQQNFYSKRGSKAKTFFSRIHWALNNMIRMSLANGALPDLESMFREMLQQNFIKVGSQISKDGMFATNVLWPNKELATGKISYYNKNEPGKIAQKASIAIQ